MFIVSVPETIQFLLCVQAVGLGSIPEYSISFGACRRRLVDAVDSLQERYSLYDFHDYNIIAISFNYELRLLNVWIRICAGLLERDLNFLLIQAIINSSLFFNRIPLHYWMHQEIEEASEVTQEL